MNFQDIQRAWRRALVPGLAASAVLAGCGSDDSANVPSSPTAAAPTPGQAVTVAPTTGKKGKKGNTQPVTTPAPASTPSGTPKQPPPLKHLKPVSLKVTAAGGIVMNPDPIPVGKNLDFTVNGPGLGQKAYIKVFDPDGNEVAYARLLARDVKMQLPAFDAGEVRMVVGGTKKVHPRSKTISVR